MFKLDGIYDTGRQRLPTVKRLSAHRCPVKRAGVTSANQQPCCRLMDSLLAPTVSAES